MSKKQSTDQATDKRLQSRLQETPIAIVGMASVFAESKNLGQFWDTIVNSVNGIQDVPEDRWAIDDYYSADKTEADKSYCKRGGFLPEVDFDPMEFGLPPNILELTDITQLMALVVARDVLEDAGLADEAAFDRDKMGVILGVGGGQKQGGQLMSRLQGPILEKVLKASGVSESDCKVIVDKYKKAYIPWEENSFPGMLGNVIAGRIANRFNLGGTNCVVDAACAGSLAAIKMAVSDLLEYRSDVMISGGICCDNSPFMYMSFSKTPAFTDGDCIRPFDDKSNGMMIGEGVGMIVLKRLEDAERDGDKIYSVIKGIGSSSDGRFKSIYAPRPEGQLKALKRAYHDAGFDPKTCGLIEAHGTGTKAGDAAEFRGLSLLFSENNKYKQHVALGSVKSQVGHTKAAAGTAGLIKASLALHHKVLPATINVDKPNVNLQIENTPLYINSETRPWMSRPDGVKRQAGISSFGFGGTNFHFVLEEYSKEQQGNYRLNQVAQSLLFHADDKVQLLDLLKESLKSLNIDADDQPYAFNQLVTSYPVKKLKVRQARCGFVAHDATQAIESLEQAIDKLRSDESKQWSTLKGIYYREQAMQNKGKVVALFSGQGSQYVNMGQELTCHFPTMMAAQTAMNRQFHKKGKANLTDFIYPIPVFDKNAAKKQELNLRQTQYAQPAIGSFSVGIYNTFKQAGFKPDFVAGHSFGELTALWAAGVLSESDYMQLAMARGQAMSAPADKNFDSGKMVAVIGDVEQVEEHIKSIEHVEIANYNTPKQAVIAGSTEAVLNATKTLTEQGFKVVELPVSAAFHTPLVKHAQKPFAQAIDKVTFNEPTTPVFANATGEVHSSAPEQIKEALQSHILQSVKFRDEIENLYQAGGRIFVEFGPKNVLTRLVDNILQDKSDIITIATNASPNKSSDQQLRLAALHLAVLGVDIKDIDPYSALPRPTQAPTRSPLAMKLNGAAYVSAKTKQDFQDALTDGWKLQQSASANTNPAVKEVIVEKVVEKIVYVDSNGKPIANPGVKSINNSQLADNIENSIEQFVKQQSQLLEVHQAYLEGPSQYAETFKTVVESQAGKQTIPQGLNKTISMYHDFQAETLRVHEAYLNNQTENMQQMLEIVAGPEVSEKLKASTNLSKTSYAATVQATQPRAPQKVSEYIQAVAPSETISVAEIDKVMLLVVADKTGYPTEMLDLSMDMEADLGIDSIKRVEILGAVQDKVQGLPELDADKLSQMRTLQEIASYMTSVVSSSAITVTSPSASQTFDTQAIEQVMLSVVSDKTGYPTEMLDLNMDMEADLGIDSIKRVEILGAVQDQVTELPELDAEKLSQMRTLAEITNYMSQVAPLSVPVVTNNDQFTAGVVEQNTITDIDKVMLAVVAEKTGYPAEMLDLSMDMEADLGIDSIKRVEILGAVQDKVSYLPELDAEQLSQMRTLQEIVNYMQQVTGDTASLLTNPVSEGTTSQPMIEINLAEIETIMLSVVADKTGYPSEMLELNMDMEADLGIDSIKRVEILGAVQDQISELPELDAEQLSQMRTLSEIVNYMGNVGVNSPQSLEPDLIAANPIVDLSHIQQVMLTVVAEKTGYPVEMLELNMDMEADLGIDSIKRVEILGAVQDKITDLPELDAEQLAQMRTLAEIVDYMHQIAQPLDHVAELKVEQIQPEIKEKDEPTSEQSVEHNIVATSQTLSIDDIQSTMLNVVSVKTGYPVQMLEMGMDMEADLGIDSIKRVEILGAVQELIPDLPELDPEQLSVMRTLGDIVEYMQGIASDNDVSEIDFSAPSDDDTHLSVTDTDLETLMLSVVSAKTGYPSDMLEMGMDMEADLGIDSIKRVEILSSVQDKLVDLPELDADHLSSLRTLGDVASYLSSQQGSETPREGLSETIDLAPATAMLDDVLPDSDTKTDSLIDLPNEVESEQVTNQVQSPQNAVDADLMLKQPVPQNLSGESQEESVTQLQAEPIEQEVREEIEIEPVEELITFTPAPSAIVDIKLLPIVECMDARVDGKNLLMVNDGQGSTVLTANNLSQLGWKVTVISPAWVTKNTTKRFDDEVIRLDIAQANQDELQHIVDSQLQWQSVIYLHPKSEVQGIVFGEKYKQGLQLAFLLAKLCNLNKVNNDARASFIAVTRQGGDFSTHKIEKKSDLVQGGLSGLVKTLSHEWDNVFCRVVDVPSRYTAEKVAGIVINELNDKKLLPVEVGYHTKGRQTLVAKSTDSYALQPGQHIDENALFLVSGGAKGVTAHCVAEIAKNHQCKFILLGRSAYHKKEESWSLSHATEADLKVAAMHHLTNNGKKPTPATITSLVAPVLANREISKTLKTISERGGTAEYINVDVCDKAGLIEAIAPICEQWGEITGVIHGAGVLADNYIEAKTLDEFEQVYSTKITGLETMLSCCKANKLKHLVLFSSAAGFYGNSGQSDYAIANEILNKTAYRFKSLHPKAQVLTLNWGPWDGGMVTPELKRMFDERGVYIIPIQSGATLLANELAADSNRCVQILVGTDMAGNQGCEDSDLDEINNKPLSTSIVKVFNHKNNALVSHHKIGDNEVLPTVCAISWMQGVCEDLYPDYKYAGIEEFKIFKGVVFDGQQSNQFLIDTKLIDDKETELCVEVIVSSEKHKGQPFFHYRSLVNMAQTKPEMMLYQDPLPDLQKKESPVVQQLYKDGTLFHGEHFRAIKHIHQIDQSGMLLECVIDQSVLRAQGEFVLVENNVIANDIAYQAMLIWTSKFLSQSSLPSSTDLWQVFREVNINEYFFVKLNITKTVAQRVIADVLILDVNGAILSKVTAAEVTCSANLNALFMVNA